jgi:hypothetical protein
VICRMWTSSPCSPCGPQKATVWPTTPTPLLSASVVSHALLFEALYCLMMTNDFHSITPKDLTIPLFETNGLPSMKYRHCCSRPLLMPILAEALIFTGSSPLKT